MNRLRNALSLLMITSALAVPGVSFAEPTKPGTPSATDQSRELFRKAIKAYENGQLQEAYENYRAAWNLLKSYDIAGNLANVEMELGKPREAALHATYAIANFPPVGTEGQRKFLEKILEDAKKEVGTLKIQVSVDHADIGIDGKLIGQSPLAGEVFVEPGLHTLTAKADGYDPALLAVQALKGASQSVSLTLTALKVAPPERVLPPPPHSPLPPRSGDSPTAQPLVVGGIIITGLALGSGVAFTILSTARADAANASAAVIGTANNPGACRAGFFPNECAALRSSLENKDTFANVAFWSFLGAGAVGAATLIYALAGPKASKRAAQAIPVVTAQGGGLTIRGSW